jgi:ubiquinone/menaquinone biosynthesis C-methylase UbiE/DNA-binding transcriptional ArsR family regulator
VETLLAALKAVAEPNRFRLVALCAAGDLTVSELTNILGLSQPGISRHLKLLTDAGVLERFSEGTKVFHRLSNDGGTSGDVARHLISLVPEGNERLARDREGLEEVKALRAKAAVSYFSSIAPEWDKIRSLHVDELEVERVLVRLLPQDIDSMLDMGTGTGRMLEIFGPRVGRAVGVDQSPEMLAIARANLERAHLENCTVRKADMYTLPFPGNSFDAVTVHQVLHFAIDPGRAIAAAARVMRPGGCLLVSDFAPHDIEDLRAQHAHHRLGFSDREVKGWFDAAGLDCGEIVHLPGDPLTVTVWQATKSIVEGALPADAGRAAS